MAEFGKEIPTNDGDQVAIVGGLESVSGEAGALAPGGVHGHYHNSPEELSGATAGAAEEVIGGLYDDGYANKRADEEGHGMTMGEMQGAVEQLTKGQDLITKKTGLLPLYENLGILGVAKFDDSPTPLSKLAGAHKV